MPAEGRVFVADQRAHFDQGLVVLEELQQLAIGLGGALLGLLAIAWLVGKAGDGEKPKSRRPESDPEGAAEPRLDQHDNLVESEADPAPKSGAPFNGAPAIAKLFITPGAGRDMKRVAEAQAIAGRGLEGDRYCIGRGFWSDRDECEITLIAQEDLDEIERTTGLRVQQGQHRRNLVTRNLRLQELAGKRFRIGEAYLTFERRRPPCRYLQSITEAGMAKALVNRGGICVHCFKGGVIREGDRIAVIEVSPVRFLARYLRSLFKGRRRAGGD